MNVLDQFIKHGLIAKFYIRYADDFVILSDNRGELEEVLSRVQCFLRDELKLELHPDKVWIKTLASGADFLGWKHFLDHRVLRTSTKRRLLKRFQENQLSDSAINSYSGLLKHGNAKKISVVLSWG